MVNLGMLFIITFAGVFAGVFSLVLYFIISRKLPRQFAMCLTCESAQFDKYWDKVMPLTCKKCNVPMELIMMPEQLYLTRVNIVKKVALSFIPLIGMFFLMMLNLWLGIALMIPIFTLLIIGIYKLDSRSKRQIINWALIHFQRAKVEIEELTQAKQIVEQREEPRPTFINVMIGWYCFLGGYFICIFLYLFFSINLLAIPEDILLYFSIGMLVATIIFSGGGPYLEKRNLAILKPLVLIRAFFYVFLLVFGSLYLIFLVIFGSTGSVIDIILTLNFFIVSFTSYFERYFLWEKFVDYNAISEEEISRVERYYVAIGLSNSILGLVFLSQYVFFLAAPITALLYLIIILAFGDMLLLNEKLAEYWGTLPPEKESQTPARGQIILKKSRVLSEHFYKTRIIPLNILLLLLYLFFSLSYISMPLADFGWYVLFIPLFIKSANIAYFFYNLYKRNKARQDL